MWIYYRLYYFFHRKWWNVKNYFRNIWNFRKGLSEYVWYCGDHGIYAILYDLLSDMEEKHRERGHLVISDKTADQIRVAKLLTKRLLDDDYLTDKFNYDIVQSSEEEGSPWGKSFNIEVTKKYDLPTEKIEKNYLKDRKRKEAEYLFSYIAKHIESWWD